MIQNIIPVNKQIYRLYVFVSFDPQALLRQIEMELKRGSSTLIIDPGVYRTLFSPSVLLSRCSLVWSLYLLILSAMCAQHPQLAVLGLLSSLMRQASELSYRVQMGSDPYWIFIMNRLFSAWGEIMNQRALSLLNKPMFWISLWITATFLICIV